MFHAAGASCLFRTVFSTHRHPASANNPAHPAVCPCRFVILATHALQSQASRQTYIYIANATRYQVHTRYTHACGVWVVFLEHGGGALGIFKSQFALTINRMNLSLSASHYFQASVAGGLCRPRSEAPCKHTWIFFLSGLGWHLPGLSQVPS